MSAAPQMATVFCKNRFKCSVGYLCKRVSRATLAIALCVAPELLAALEVIHVDVSFRVDRSRPELIINVETNPMLNVGEYAKSAQTMDLQKLAQMQAQMPSMVAQMNSGEMFEKYPSITITLPLLEYGSKGSWSNVEIETLKGKSYNPEYMRQSGSNRYLGKVTIDEFTRFVIAGSFSADIYSQEQTGIFVKEGSHSGWFRSAMPVADDPRESSELSTTELARMEASAILDSLSMVRGGLSGSDPFSGSWDSPNIPSTTGSSLPSPPVTSPPLSTQLPTLPEGSPEISSEDGGCICMCEYMAILTPGNACRQKCEAGGLQCLDESDDPGTDALMQELQSMDMPPEMAKQLYDSLKDLTPAQRAQMLEMYRNIARDSG